MNLFDKTVDEALKSTPTLSPLRAVVEKELLHHDILRTLKDSGYLDSLTFMGGTCLRACYGGQRLSEDLDFTAGADFKKDQLITLGEKLSTALMKKYGLKVVVSEPQKEDGMVNTWKIKVETRPELTFFPSQRINIDICKIPSYEKRPAMILNHYGVDTGTGSLILQVQTQEEIYADKIIAVALRQNRLKYRDLWDIQWLHGKGIQPSFHLIPLKLADRNILSTVFLRELASRVYRIQHDEALGAEFMGEMKRFIPPSLLSEDIWNFIKYLMGDLEQKVTQLF